MNILNDLAIIGAKYLYLIIIIIAAIFFFKQPRDVQKKMVVYGVVTFPIMYAVLKIAALFYYDPRPFVVGHFTPLIPHAADNGFPSDHSILSAAIAAIVFPFSRRWSAVLWLLTVGVAVSRVYVGIHHPIDVLVSILIAIVVGWLVYSFIVPKAVRSAWYKRLASQYFTS